MPYDLNEILKRPGRPDLAFRRSPGAGPTLVWLGGFKSDMTGSKAQALHEWAQGQGRAFVRFDYSGHGASGGRFEEGTISSWAGDARDAVEALTQGPLILIGSSMGGWISLLTALAFPARVAGLVLIAPAPDFTERLVWAGLNEEQRRVLMETGRWEEPSAYDPEPYVLTRALIEDGRKHLLLDGPIAVRAPVRILHGQRDEDVPWRQSLDLAEQLETADVTVTFVKDGDHRLSRSQDIARLIQTVDSLASTAASPSR